MTRKAIMYRGTRPRHPRPSKASPYRFNRLPLRLRIGGKWFSHFVYVPGDPRPWVVRFFTRTRHKGKELLSGAIWGLVMRTKDGERLELIAPEYYERDIVSEFNDLIKENAVEIGGKIHAWNEVVHW